MSTPATRSRARWRQLWTRLPFFIWLVVLWMLLWGQLTVLAAVTGIVMAVFVMLVFRLPTVELSGRLNPWHAFVFGVIFMWSLVRGSLIVAWQAVGPATTKAGIVRVPLRIDDDLVMTHTAVVCSLIPGSLVLEADRENRVLYLHALGIENADDAAALRASVQKWEARAVRAIGSRVQVALVSADVPPVIERRRAVLD